jgi:hypothetical protein
MAPYTMTIDVQNETEYNISWVGASTLSKLDGNTSVGSLDVQPRSTSSISIKKSGGTDGLFTALTWVVFGDSRVNYKIKFSVWSSMPVTVVGSKVTIALADVTGGSDPQYQINTWADYCYGSYRPSNSMFGDVKEKDGVRVRVSLGRRAAWN